MPSSLKKEGKDDENIILFFLSAARGLKKINGVVRLTNSIDVFYHRKDLILQGRNIRSKTFRRTAMIAYVSSLILHRSERYTAQLCIFTK